MKPLPGWFRYTSWAMAVLFAVCVALQVNDPDPVRWMAIYGVAAVVSAALPAKRAAWMAGLLLGAGSFVWALALTLQVWGVIEPADLVRKMSEKGGAVEVGREAGGLWIQAVWLLAASAFRRTRT
ncbi:MAG: transmembrane 220 family protein [Kofleriaceae bacterium]